MEQLSMFTAGEDLPLFSGTPMKANPAEFKPSEHVMQLPLIPCRCRACQDTGTIGDKFCWCEAGVEAKRRKRTEATSERLDLWVSRVRQEVDVRRATAVLRHNQPEADRWDDLLNWLAVQWSAYL